MAKPDNELTPMKRQYNQIKSENQDCILFFRLGDFYEMFDDDAKVAAKELDLTLTTRDRNKPREEQTPMCGVPYHSVDSYIARLVGRRLPTDAALLQHHARALRCRTGNGHAGALRRSGSQSPP